jgi:large subunit ribosomal protein L21
VINYEVAPGGAFTMFAIVATSGKQFKVSEGDRILVDRVPANVGETVRLDSVLMLGGDAPAMVGTPFVSGAAVEATVVSHRLGDKIIVFKFEARKRHRRKTGHRQQLSELRIGAIQAPGAGHDAAATGGAARSRRGEARPAKTATSKARKAPAPPPTTTGPTEETTTQE